MSGKFHEEIVQQKLLLELMEIFKKTKNSSLLSSQVRDALVKYEPFKEFDSYLKGGSGNKQPTAQQMAEALKEMLSMTQIRYKIAESIAQASKVEMKGP